MRRGLKGGIVNHDDALDNFIPQLREGYSYDMKPRIKLARCDEVLFVPIFMQEHELC